MKSKGLSPDVELNDETARGALVRLGFLGRSAREGHWRLYTHPDLTEYIEFSGSDVLKVERISELQSPLGGSMIWFDRDAQLQRTGTRSIDEQASFLKGPVTSGFLQSARRTNLGAAGLDTATIVETVISFLVACPSHWIGCSNLCTVHCGETVLGVCPIYSLFCTYEKQICG